MFHFIFTSSISLFICAILVITSGTAVMAKNTEIIQFPKELREFLTKGEKLRVLVTLKGNFKPEGTLSEQDSEVQRTAIAQLQKQFLDSLKDFSLHEKTFATIPFVAIEIDQVILERVLKNPLVESITLDEAFSTQPSTPFLSPAN